MRVTHPPAAFKFASRAAECKLETVSLLAHIAESKMLFLAGGSSCGVSPPAEHLIKDIDVQDEFETYTCASYASDIYANLFAAEVIHAYITCLSCCEWVTFGSAQHMNGYE